MKGATIAYYVSWLAWQVSIHAPVKGATQSDTFVGDKLPVSIHAPVKGATKSTTPRVGDWEVSIHAPVKGATLTKVYPSMTMTFQFTLP